MSFFNELKRRNVFKVGIAYIVIVWLVAQVLQLIFESFGTPVWVMKTVLVLLATGLPFALFFAWAFEMTPEGLKRESEIDRSQSITTQTGRKLNNATIGVLVVALAYFAVDKFVFSTGRDEALVEATAKAITQQSQMEQQSTKAESEMVDNSIAVLPFADMSPNKDQDYFSDGLSEELLNLLAKIPELRVAARTSSFSFKDQNVEIPVIAERLKVAHILEGSVRTAGNKIRVTAQLIKAADGYHLWSETFDRDLDDIFAIQDEIAAEVVAQLKVTLLGDVPTTRIIDPKAYALFLRGRQSSRAFSAESLQQGIDLYEQALAIDPAYVEVWSELSRNYINQVGNGLRPREEGLALTREAISRVLAIEPDNAEAMASNGWLAMSYDNDLETAAKLYENAIKLDPSSIDIQRNVATLVQYLGRIDEAISIGEYIVARDPLNIAGHAALANAYLIAGRLDDARDGYELVLSLSPERIGAQYSLGAIRLLNGDPEAALAYFAKENDDEFRTRGNALAYYKLGQNTEFQSAFAELQEQWGGIWPSSVAQVYAWSGDVDTAFTWLEKELEVSGNLRGQGEDPFLANLHQDARWQTLLEKSGDSTEQLAAIEFNFTLPQ